MTATLQNLGTGRTMQVEVIDLPPTTWAGRGQLYEVLGTGIPVVATAPAATAEGYLKIRAKDWADRQQLQSLLLDGNLLHITSTGCREMDTFTFVALGWEDPWTGPVNSERTYTIHYRAVSQNVVGGIAGQTYDQAEKKYATYDAAENAVATYEAGVWP